MRQSRMKIKGRLRWRHTRRGIIIGEGVIPNQIKNEAIDEALAVLFTAENTYAYYMGLMDQVGYTSGPAVDDTYANLKLGSLGWQEMPSNYYNTLTNLTRMGINFALPSGGLITSEADPTEFVITANGDGESVRGVMVTSQLVYADTAGWIWSTVLLPAPRLVLDTDVLQFGYEVSLARG